MRNLTYRHQKIVIIILFLFFPILFLSLFSYYPAVKLVELSFSNWNGYSQNYDYVGFKNYINLLQDEETWRTFLNTFAYVIITVIKLALALYLAIVLNSRIRARNMFRSILFMPYILNGVAVAYMFSYLYDFERGPINLLLHAVGLGEYSVRFFTNSYSINFSLAFISLWKGFGFFMILFLGGLQSVPKEQYEAAYIDGANFWQNLRFVTLPNIQRVTEVCMLLGFSGAIQAFNEAFLITEGGPAGRSSTFVLSMYNIAFQYQNFGKSSAMGVALFLIIFCLMSIQRLLVQKGSD